MTCIKAFVEKNAAIPRRTEPSRRIDDSMFLPLRCECGSPHGQSYPSGITQVMNPKLYQDLIRLQKPRADGINSWQNRVFATNVWSSDQQIRSLSTQREQNSAKNSSRDPLLQKNISKSDENSLSAPTPPPNSKAAIKLLINNWVQTLMDLQRKLKPLPPLWRLRESDVDQEYRYQVLLETRSVLRNLLETIQAGRINPKGEHSHEVGFLLELILQLYSETACATVTITTTTAAPRISAFSECQAILKAMKGHPFHMELRQSHCEYAVTAAAREGRWKEAAEWFSRQIDPDADGYVPIDMKLSNPIGLYVIAKHAQLEAMRHKSDEDNNKKRRSCGVAVVESVMDAVRQMTMVSPMDSAQYVLAAGKAIGYTGEWEAFVDYLKTSYNASHYGEPLATAIMHACLLSGRPEEALKVYNDLVAGKLVVGGGSWGMSGEPQSSALTRDLAMQAIGAVCHQRSQCLNDDNEVNTLFDQALDLLEQSERDGLSVSLEALNGVIRSCEYAGKWEEAVSLLLFSVLDQTPQQLSQWLVSNEDMRIPDRELITNPLEVSKIYGELGDALASTMRVCNAAGEPGTALLCFRVFQSVIPHQVVEQICNVAERKVHNSNIPESMHSVILTVKDQDAVMTALMVSLCNVGSVAESVHLFESMEDVGPKTTDTPAANAFYQHLRVAERTTQHPSPWNATDQHISRVISIFQSLRRDGKSFPSQDAVLFSYAMAATLRLCTHARNPLAGIFLIKWIVKEARYAGPTELLSIFIQGDFVGENRTMQVSDSLCAAVLDAYNCSEQSHQVAALFESSLGNRSFEHSLLSTNEILKALFKERRHEDGMKLFEKVIAYNRNQDTFSIAARGSRAAQDWNRVFNIFRLALTCGCLSEELSILTMSSVARAQIEKKMVLLRNIVGETASLLGMSPNTWVESRYWKLKREVGFPSVARIMRWDDSETRHWRELEFAIWQFERSLKSKAETCHDALPLIVTAAAHFEEGMIPSEKNMLPLIPRDRIGWSHLLLRALREAQRTTLMGHPFFVQTGVAALHRLGCYQECVDFVKEALSRKVQLNALIIEIGATVASETGDVTLLRNLELLKSEAPRRPET